MNDIEVKTTGIQCDYCDWKDETIPFSDLKDWINKPCPKCGENLLTEEDFNNAMQLMATVNFLNSLSEEDIEELNKLSDKEHLKNILSEEDYQKVINSNPNDRFHMEVSTHKEIKIKTLKKLDEHAEDNK